MSIFQLVLLMVFGLFFMIGLVVVAIYSNQGNKNNTQTTNVIIWGTYDGGVMRDAIDKINFKANSLSVSYVQKAGATFNSDLAEAIAIGKGPDVILLRQDSLMSNLKKISPISYDTYPLRDFKNAFVEEGELFTNAQGVLGIPFVIDPLVMYWNRDLFSQAGLANPPRFWDELFSLASQLTKLDGAGNVVQSGAALGAYGNINNAKEILSMLFIQSGNKIANWNAQRNAVEVTLSQSLTPADNVLSFYTQFSDVRKSVYSWSRALSDSQSMFLSNRLGIYFGFASEAKTLKAKSPNLNFDAALVPQTRNSSAQGTFGRLYALAILRSSKNVSAAYTALQALTSAGPVKNSSILSGLPPVRRDVQVVDAKDTFRVIFTQSALISKAWLEPSVSESENIFKNMIESVLAGFLDSKGAISEANQQLRLSYSR